MPKKFRYTAGAVCFALSLAGSSLAVSPAARAFDSRLSPWAGRCAQGGCAGGGFRPPVYIPPPVYQPSPSELRERQSVALNTQGNEQDRLGHYAEALRLYELALKMTSDENSARVIRQNMGNTYSRIGLAAYKSGDIAGALHDYELAAQYNPSQKAYGDSVSTLRNQIMMKQQEANASAHVKEIVQNLSESIAAAPAASDLDFDGFDRGKAAVGRAGLDFQSFNAPNPAVDKKVADARNPPAGTDKAPGSVGGLNFQSFSSPNATVDTNVVDARNVVTGLPKEVEAQIPQTPSGNWVRKGFEAIQNHDWNVALACFQDALNRDPNNAGLKRLVDLAQYTLQKRVALGGAVAPAAASVDDETARKAYAANNRKLDAESNRSLQASLDDFNRNYLPKHPELAQPNQVQPSGPSANLASVEQSANWQAFFDALFKGGGAPNLSSYSVGAVRD